MEENTEEKGHWPLVSSISFKFRGGGRGGSRGRGEAGQSAGNVVRRVGER